MRCGRDTGGEQAFCPDCLQVMERYPVDPDTVVQLPRRKSVSPSKRLPRRRTLSPEERIAQLRRRTRRLAVALVVLAVAFVLLAIPTVNFLIGARSRPGQNYKLLPSTVSTTAATGSTAGD